MTREAKDKINHVRSNQAILPEKKQIIQFAGFPHPFEIYYLRFFSLFSKENNNYPRMGLIFMFPNRAIKVPLPGHLMIWVYSQHVFSIVFLYGE